MESELKNAPEPVDVPIQEEIKNESNRTLFLLIGIFLLALILLIYTVTRNQEPSDEKNDKAFSNVILEVFNLTKWESSEAQKIRGDDTYLFWNNSNSTDRFVISYPNDDLLYLKTSEEEMTEEEADLFIKEITTVLSKYEFKKDPTRKMVSPWSGGADFKDSEVWSDETHLYFLIKVNLWDDSWDKYYVEFGYLGLKEKIEELEEEQLKILSALPQDDSYAGKYIEIDRKNNISKETVIENEEEIRGLVWLVHQSCEPMFFYYSQNKETKEITPLIWEEDNGEIYINIKNCEELIEKEVEQDEFLKLIEVMEEGYVFKEIYFEHLMNCYGDMPNQEVEERETIKTF
jgi:hypothetical protein